MRMGEYELVKKDDGDLARRFKNERFSLEINLNSLKLQPANEIVKKFAEEHFGSYEKYLKEIRRFIQEDAVKLLDALGREPLLYRQDKKGDKILMLLQYLHQGECQIDPELAFKRQEYSDKEVVIPTPVEDIPRHVFWYVPGAEFYLTENEFSMFIGMVFVPILTIGDNGRLSEFETTSHQNSWHKWGGLAQDIKLYHSLTSIVRAVEEGKDMPLIKIEWSDGYCEFFKKQHKFGEYAHKYMLQHHPKLLEAPKE